MEQDRYARQEARWNNRFGEPVAPVRRPESPATVESSSTQHDVNFAYAIDQAHATGDPMELFHAQLRELQRRGDIPPVEKPGRIVFDASKHQA